MASKKLWSAEDSPTFSVQPTTAKEVSLFKLLKQGQTRKILKEKRKKTKKRRSWIFLSFFLFFSFLFSFGIRCA